MRSENKCIHIGDQIDDRTKNNTQRTHNIYIYTYETIFIYIQSEIWEIWDEANDCKQLKTIRKTN